MHSPINIRFIYLLCVRPIFHTAANTVLDSQYATYHRVAKLRQASVTRTWRFYVFQHVPLFKRFHKLLSVTSTESTVLLWHPKSRLSPSGKKRGGISLHMNIEFFFFPWPPSSSDPTTTSNHLSLRRWEKAPVLLSYIRLQPGHISAQCKREIQSCCFRFDDVPENTTEMNTETCVLCRTMYAL